MSKSKSVLKQILEVVSAECDVPAEKIISKCSEAELVDARWICVKLLGEYGFYANKIADLVGITPRYVQYILTDFEDRIAVSRMMRTNYEMAKKRLRTTDLHIKR